MGDAPPAWFSCWGAGALLLLLRAAGEPPPLDRLPRPGPLPSPSPAGTRLGLAAGRARTHSQPSPQGHPPPARRLLRAVAGASWRRCLGRTVPAGLAQPSPSQAGPAGNRKSAVIHPSPLCSFLGCGKEAAGVQEPSRSNLRDGLQPELWASRLGPNGKEEPLSRSPRRDTPGA